MNENILNILRLYFQGEPLSQQQQADLEQWQNLSIHNEEAFELLNNEQFIRASVRTMSEYGESQATHWKSLSNELFRVQHVTTTPVHFLKTAWFRYAAAIIIILGIGAYLWNTKQKEKVQVTTTKPVPVKNDILPGSDRAILTLSNGQQVQLSDSVSETIKDGNLSIENNNGQLSYKNAEVVAINTMTTPKGGQYQLTLADGTKVWLNAASSITFPSAFKGSTREVSITGEAYFEVVKNSAYPFIVTVNKEVAIQVLGTSFNINAYGDEPSIKATLVEGSIQLVKNKQAHLLKPLQQAVVDQRIDIKNNVNIEQVIAWKNGLFNFEGVNIETFMRQLSRWYDITIEYRGIIPKKRLKGELSRDLTLSQILEILKQFNIQYTFEGRKLIIG